MRTGQATISRLETGNYNPSVKFLRRLAKALDAKLTIRLV
jgi:transcriptional regulator with XRE-family HTH domain